MKKTLIYILILGILSGCGFFAYRNYTRGRQNRLVNQARRYLEKNNQRKALLTLQRALHYNTNDVEVCRLMARLDELSHSFGALYWRERVVDLNPGSLEDRLALAGTALAFRDNATAARALDGVNEAGKRTAAYQNSAGAIAAQANQPAQAEAHFLEALKIEPQNDAAQLNLAVIRLQGTNVSAQAAAQVVLQKLASASTNSYYRCQALRELFIKSVRDKQFDQAMALSGQLLQNTNSIFHDRLLVLELLEQSRKSEFPAALALVQREAAGKTNSADIYELAMWQMAHTSPTETLAWLKTMPSSVQTNTSVAMVIAESEATVQDWGALSSFLAHQNWGEIEFLRHAFYSRALRGLSSSGGSKAEWELALKTANTQKASLEMLLGLTKQWNWQSESEELLWAIVTNYPHEGVFVQELTRALYTSGRTRSLMLLCSQQLKRAPDRLELKRNLALLALLLDAQDLKPHALAREVYEKSSTNASYTATYAFSLLLQNKKAEALSIMQKLTPKEAESAAVAGYYGLVLQANGESAKARTYLDMALKRQMLPEEQKLFQKARSGA